MRLNQSASNSPSNIRKSQVSCSHSSSLEDSSLSSSQQLIIVSPKKSKRPTENTRIFLSELAQVIDIPPQLQNQQVLARSCYFGKYGKIKKMDICEKPTDIKPSKKNHVVYITYENMKDAALAIVSIKIFHHQTFKCLSNYGTTRYCLRWLNNQTCTYRNCYYLHEIAVDNIIVDYKQHIEVEGIIKKAKMMIASNLIYYIQKERKQYLQKQQANCGLIKCSCHWVEANKRDFIKFPTVGETINYLIEEKFIQKKQYKKLKEEYKAQFRPQKQIQKKSEVQMKKIQQNASEQGELKTILKSQTSHGIESKPVSISAENFLYQKYFIKKLKNRVLTPESQKIQDYYAKRIRQMSKNIFRSKNMTSQNFSAQEDHNNISSFRVQKRLIEFLQRDRSQTSIFEFAFDGKERGRKIKDVIQKSLMKEN